MVFDCEASKRSKDGSLQITGDEAVGDLVDLLLADGEDNKRARGARAGALCFV
jgi:hypothetical protein